jgi:PAS domain S-box-containing protein
MTLKKKITYILFASTIIPMMLIGALGYINAKKALETVRIEGLRAIADLKAQKIEGFFAEVKRDLMITREDPDLRRTLSTLSKSSGNFSSLVNQAQIEELDRVLEEKVQVHQYLDVILVNPEGKIVYAVDTSYPINQLDDYYSDIFEDAFANAKHGGVYFSDIYKESAYPHQFAMLVVAPVRVDKETFVGWVAIEINMNPIYEFIQETTGLGKTGETLVAKKIGNEALFLNPLRHDPNAVLKRKAVFGKKRALPIQEALNGEKGFGALLDYRGKEVIAAWRYIHLVGWGMVAKIDIVEAYAPAIYHRNLVLILLGVLGMLSVMISLFLAKSISDPIKNLQKGVMIIGKGNLNHKIGTDAGDEIGQLGKAFDQMTENLKDITASRDELEKEIKERCQAEQALQLTRFSIDRANDMLYWIDSQGQIVDVNDTACKNLGYSKNELLSMRVIDIEPVITDEKYSKIWRDLRVRRSFKVVTTHHTKSGKRIPVEITFNYIEFGGKEYSCAFARDISERIEAEEALQQSMNQLGKRVKELNCLFSLSNLVERRDSSLDDILRGTVDILPTAWQYPDVTCANIILEDKEFKTLNFKETQWNVAHDIYVHGKRSGKVIVCYLEEEPDCDEGPFLKEEKSLLRAVAERLGRVVERKLAEDMLQRSEKRFRRLVENSLTGISIVQDGQVVYQNKEQERLLGPLPRPRILDDVDRIHPDDIEKVKELSDSLSSSKMRPLDINFRFVTLEHKDSFSEMTWVNCRASKIEFRGRDAILVNMMDVTQTKKLEHLLTVQDKMASLGRVAAGIAHEIRNPLSGINIYLNTLQKLYDRGEGQQDKIKEIFQHVKSASAKIESVIRRVMDFSKPSEPKFVSADINQPIEEAIKLTAVTMRKSGVQVGTVLSEKLPQCRCDPQLIEEVILNLMNNAADAMKKTKGEKKIRIISSSDKHHVTIRILDSGPGIPVKFREMIFDPFYTTKPDSTGIGLSLCHRIISDHGGSIRMETGKLGGAEFIIEIPIITSND